MMPFSINSFASASVWARLETRSSSLTHMVTGSIAYRILENESPRTVSIIKTLLEKHPWYADRWRDNLEKLPESQRGEMLFMLAARWADDIRMQAKLQREVKWHYINFPFKLTGEPEDIKPLPSDPDNILSALAENRRIVKSQVSADKRAIALAWLFHLVGDVHQPLDTVQLIEKTLRGRITNSKTVPQGNP